MCYKNKCRIIRYSYKVYLTGLGKFPFPQQNYHSIIVEWIIVHIVFLITCYYDCFICDISNNHNWN